jgi:hypothetical protein
MAKIKTHIEDCEAVLGESFEDIHRWMDWYAKKWKPFIYLEYHRQFRHNDKAVQYVKEKWGHYACQAAKLHIIRDNEMYLPGIYPISAIREDQVNELYEKALKYCHPIRKDWKQWIEKDLP